MIDEVNGVTARMQKDIQMEMNDEFDRNFERKHTDRHQQFPAECCGTCRWSMERWDLHGRGDCKRMKCRKRLEEDGVTMLRMGVKEVCELYAPRTITR